MTFNLQQEWEALQRLWRYNFRNLGGPRALALSLKYRGIEPRIRAERLGSRWVDLEGIRDGGIHIVREVDVMLAETAGVTASRPYFQIVHRFHQYGSNRDPKTEIIAVLFPALVDEPALRLTPAYRALLGYLARHQQEAQTALEIARGVQRESFYTPHHSASGILLMKPVTIARNSVKVLIPRLQKEVARAFARAGALYDPNRVVISEPTVTNQKLYKLHATVEWFRTSDLST